MSLQHIFKNSSVSGKEPTASQLANGELSINYHADGPFLCCKDTAGVVRRIAGVWVAATAPGTPTAGELWLDTSLNPTQLKIYKDGVDGWVFAGNVVNASTTTAGVVELSTDAETQAGGSTVVAVTPASLQSKLSDSTSTSSSTTIASSSAVKAAYDLAATAISTSGGTITGTLEIGDTGSLTFEGSSVDAYETTLAVVDPTADRTITLPDVSGTVITTGDTGTVTSTMLADGTIVDADINASAAIALSKLATGALPSGITIASANITDDTIVDADINASAAIADTKLATISTAGKVSGTAITSGNINTSGDLLITNSAPVIRITESDGVTTHSQAVIQKSDNVFSIQTRNSTGTLVSTDYRIEADASGATDQSWRIANTEKARLNSDGLKIVDDLIISDKIIHNGDTDTAIRFPAADTVAIETAGSERLRVTSDGNVGVGTTSPAYTLDVAGQARIGAPTGSAQLELGAGATENRNAYIDFVTDTTHTDYAFRIRRADAGANANTTFEHRGTGNLSFINTEAAPHIWYTNGTERARIDSSGRLLVGTSSTPPAVESIVPQFVSSSADVSTAAQDIAIYNYQNAGGSGRQRVGPKLFFGNSRSGTNGSLGGIVPSNEVLGNIRFAGDDGTNLITAAEINAEVDGTPGANDMPGRLVFSVTADGSASPTEAMRINSTQELLVGYTSDNGAYKLQVNSQIFATSATIATSDGRYKDNVTTLDGCADLIRSLRPVSFDWKPQQNITRLDEDGNETLVREGHNFPAGTQVGFIAQEVQDVLTGKPWLGSIIKENVRPAITDADGTELAPEEQFYGIAEGNLIAVLTSALKDALSEIDALKARVAALEAP